MEEQRIAKAHKLVVNNRKTSTVTGVLDVLSFDLNEILLETEQGMLMVKGTDLHVNRLTVEKGEPADAAAQGIELFQLQQVVAGALAQAAGLGLGRQVRHGQRDHDAGCDHEYIHIFCPIGDCDPVQSVLNAEYFCATVL